MMPNHGISNPSPGPYMTPTLLAVLAHPDDETICSGVLAMAAARGWRVVLASATRGEAGEIADASLATPETLGAVREEELRCACGRLGIEEPRLLGYCDSGMAGALQNEDPRSFTRADPHTVQRQIVTLIRKLQPHSVITFEPFGIYGHPDHIAISRFTTEAFDYAGEAEAFRESGPPWRPQYLYYGGLSLPWFEEVQQRIAQLALDRPVFEALSEQMKGHLEAFTAQITHEIDVSGYLPKKVASLACHRTQLTKHAPFFHLIKPNMADLFSPEYYVEVRRSAVPLRELEESLFV